ncbi:MAG: DUF1851 domain-containing protein [Tabrizicola sp.]|nr:DUF1851 domain-containing protein [Tabrizicola sp.]
MDQLFSDDLKGRGILVRREGATPNQVSFAADHVSETYSQFIAQYGYCMMFDGRFQFCPIERFRPLAALIFKADPDFSHNDCHIVGFSAFGSLIYAWSEKHDFVKIDLLKYRIECNTLAPDVLDMSIFEDDDPPRPQNRESLTRLILPFEENDCDIRDYDDNLMYAQCAKACGALEYGQVYGFFPSLGFVGYKTKFRSVENINRVKALEHFAMIAQMQDFHLVRYNMGRDEIVRPIG